MGEDYQLRQESNEIERNLRLVDWNVEVLFELLQKLVVSRNGNTTQEPDVAEAERAILDQDNGRIIIDEMTQILSMPSLDRRTVKTASAAPSIKPIVKEQLREFVQQICALYRTEVPFHNFKHASHVIMSAGKRTFKLVSCGLLPLRNLIVYFLNHFLVEFSVHSNASHRSSRRR